MNFKRIHLLLLLLSTTAVVAQEKLTFENALELTLASNYDILMAQLDEEVAENTASKKNNDYLPTLSAAGGYNWTYYGGKNELISGDVTYDPNNSYAFNAGATLNYTLFNGGGKRYGYLQTKAQHELSKVQLQQVIETTLLELSSVYNEVARLEESVLSLEQAVAISEERYTRVVYRYEYGQAKQLDVLNAKVDLNTDSINLVNGLQQLSNLKRNLNLIMGRDIAQEFTVEQHVTIRNDIEKEQVVEAAGNRNLQLQGMQHQLKSSEYAIKANQSRWLPSLNAAAGYQYRGTDDPNGAFVVGTNSSGPQAGLTLSWTIFDGKNNTQVQNAKLNLQNQQLEQQSVMQQVKSKAMNDHSTYHNALFVLRSQADNLATAEDNFKRSEEAFKLGQLTTVEFRQAQLNLLNAEQALSKAKYDAKNAEMQVLATMGDLVK
jgi:outer membrane protein